MKYARLAAGAKCREERTVRRFVKKVRSGQSSMDCASVCLKISRFFTTVPSRCFLSRHQCKPLRDIGGAIGESIVQVSAKLFAGPPLRSLPQLRILQSDPRLSPPELVMPSLASAISISKCTIHPRTPDRIYVHYDAKKITEGQLRALRRIRSVRKFQKRSHNLREQNS